jgi:hypothetical protein
LDGFLLHDSYPSIASYWKKFDSYTSIEASALSVGCTNLLRALAVAPLRCCWLFFARGGYRDGRWGAFVAFASALYPLAAAWKAWRKPNA